MPRSLTFRVSMFFLAVLACVLLGFAVTVYLLVRSYLYGQVDNRLEGGLDTLVAAAETTDQGLEWETTDHAISLGSHGGDQAVWLVQDELGHIIERSRDMTAAQQGMLSPILTSNQRGERLLDRNRRPWRIRQRRLIAPKTDSQALARVPAGERGARYASLVMSVGAPLASAEAELRRLLVTLIVLSIALWGIAALVGWWLCRRALVPVTHMAATARSLRPDALEQRLPSPDTRDELEDLCGAFNDLLDRLQESFERQARFTGDASHQLRSPLTAMLGQIDVALLRQRSPEEYRQALVHARAQAVRLTEIVETLLFLSRADSESQLPNLTPIELDHWLVQHLQNWSGHPRAKDLRRTFGGGDVIWVRAQSSLLAQLVDNLLDNAAKYSPTATPITVSLTCDRDAAVLTVEDAGYGIADADLPHIFEPFFRSVEARQLGKSGLGLGLAVTQRIASAFGGQITAESPPGRLGSRFALRLPRIGGVGPQEDAAAAEPEPLTTLP